MANTAFIFFLEAVMLVEVILFGILILAIARIGPRRSGDIISLEDFLPRKTKHELQNFDISTRRHGPQDQTSRASRTVEFLSDGR